VKLSVNTPKSFIRLYFSIEGSSQGRISLLGGPGLKYVRGPLHYDKPTVGHKKYCLKSCIPEREW